MNQPTSADERELDRWVEEREQREVAILRELPTSLPYVTRVVMASDLAAMERVQRDIRERRATATDLIIVGSYARFTHLLWLLDNEYVTRSWAIAQLAQWWPASDPDDTDPRLLELWHEARFVAGAVILDNPERTLPLGDPLTVYRGQRPEDLIGFAWSLDRDVAEKFARGGSFRVPIDGGVIITARVARAKVLAYLTDRGEEEVIVDPSDVDLATQTVSAPLVDSKEWMERRIAERGK